MDVERLYRQSGIATEANSQFRSSESIQSGFPPTFHFSRLPSPDPLLRDLLKRNTRKILELRFKSRMRESDAKRFRNVEDFRRSFFIRSLDKIFGNRGGKSWKRIIKIIYCCLRNFVLLFFSCLILDFSSELIFSIFLLMKAIILTLKKKPCCV